VLATMMTAFYVYECIHNLKMITLLKNCTFLFYYISIFTIKVRPTL